MHGDARYEVIRKLGEGGMGVVYLARDRVLERKVALKALKGASERQRARFMREAQALASLVHSGVVRVFDFDHFQGDPCLVLEYLPGQSLFQRVKEEGALPPREAAGIMVQIATTVAHVHRHGILHRDLKPENVIVHEGRPVLLDFGLCKYSSGGDSRLLTRASVGVGSPGYMAPEQINDAHNADALSDVFGLGATFYALLVGRQPFMGKQAVQILLATLKHDPAPPSSVHPEIDPVYDAVVARCLQKDPHERYPSVEALIADLQALLTGQPLALHETLIASGDTVPPSTAFARLMEVGFESDDEVEPPQGRPSPSQQGSVGDAKVEAGDFAGAAAAYQRSLEGRDDTAVRLKFAYALRCAGESERAIDEYGHVLAVWPDDYRAHVGRGAARANLEDYAGAVVDFRRALKVLPNDYAQRSRIKAALRAAAKKVRETKIQRVTLVNPFQRPKP